MPDTPTSSKRPELYMALAAAKLRGLAQWQVAAMAGVDPSSFSKILNRERDPKPDQVAAIAAALGTPADELFPDLPGSSP